MSAAVLVLLLNVQSAWPQTAAVSGTLECRVVDASGASVPGVSVTARQTVSGLARTAATNEQGVARISALAAGSYSISFERAGFAPVAVESLLISVGQTVVQRVTLSPAAVSERLEVQERADALQTQATTADAALSAERIEEAPAANRNYLNFVLSAPGVSSSPRGNTGRSAAGIRNSGNDSGFVFAGMRGRNNSISIDGVDNRDEATGGNRVAVGLEMVQEFRVAGTAVGTEFGGAAGGLVNMVTRSGENLWHGDFTFFEQHEKLNARNPEAEVQTRPRFRRHQPGVSVGGPIRRDRSFFFSAVEYGTETSEEWSEAPAAFRLINDAIARLGIPVSPLRRSLFDAGESDVLASIKASHSLAPGNTVSARYAFSRGLVRRDMQSVDNFTDFTARGSSRVADHSLVGGWSRTLGTAFVNDLRVQLSRRGVDITPNGRGPMYDIPGVVSFGTSHKLDQQRSEWHQEAVETISFTRGAHLASAGVSAHRVGFDSRLANRFHGIYLFPDLAAFLGGQPDVFMQAFGDPRTTIKTWPVGLWLQDRWQITPGLSLEGGLRYDHQWLPAPFPSPNKNVAPRFGLAWHPGGNSNWVLRFGTGLFFDRYPLEYLNDAVQKDGIGAREQYLTGPDAVTAFRASGGGPLAAPLPGIGLATYRVAPGFTSTYSRKITAGMERKLDADTTFTAEWSDVRGLHLPRLRNAALTLPPDYHLEQSARSHYRGLSLAVNRRLKNDFTYLISYSIGKAEDDASDYDEQPLNPANTRLDWSLSRLHQRQRVALSGIWEIPLDGWKTGGPAWLREGLQEITLAPVVSYGTGRPLNPLLTSDVYRTGAFPLTARPAGVARNSDLAPRLAVVDMRVMKTIPMLENRARLQFGVEGFNLLNHSNRLRVSPFVGTGYKGVIEVLNPRQLQLMIQFEY